MTDYTKMTASEMLQEVGDDAQKWAAAFCQTAEKLGHHGIDEGWMIGWFANAIEQSTAVRAARTPAPEGEVVCSGCEGHPVFPNVPCAVCGASPVVPVGREEIVRLIENNICAKRHGPSSGWLELLGIDDAADAILAALGTKETNHD